MALYHVGSVSVSDRVALLVSCDMIACRACRIMSDRVAIVFRVDAEIGGTGIVRHY